VRTRAVLLSSSGHAILFSFHTVHDRRRSRVFAAVIATRFQSFADISTDRRDGYSSLNYLVTGGECPHQPWHAIAKVFIPSLIVVLIPSVCRDF
jgi:hypothetical protein